MKAYKPLWMLYSRSIVYKLLALTGALILVDGAAFLVNLQGAPYLAEAIPECIWQYAFNVSVPVLLVILILPGWNGGRSDYTLDRLGLDRRKVYLARAAFHALCLALLVALQGLVLALFCFGFEALPQNQLPGPQNVPMAFYRSAFLHSLLPLADWLRFVRNLVMILAFGLVSALTMRRNHKDFAKITLAVVYTAFFTFGFGAVPLMNRVSDITFMVVALIAAGLAVRAAWAKEAEPDAETR